VFVHVAVAAHPPLFVAHSFTSVQVTPSPVNPGLHAHVDPTFRVPAERVRATSPVVRRALVHVRTGDAIAGVAGLARAREGAQGVRAGGICAAVVAHRRSAFVDVPRTRRHCRCTRLCHAQVKPPGVFVQVASVLQFAVPFVHSSSSVHAFPSPVNPGLHSQVKLPGVFGTRSVRAAVSRSFGALVVVGALRSVAAEAGLALALVPHPPGPCTSRSRRSDTPVGPASTAGEPPAPGDPSHQATHPRRVCPRRAQTCARVFRGRGRTAATGCPCARSPPPAEAFRNQRPIGGAPPPASVGS